MKFFILLVAFINPMDGELSIKKYRLETISKQECLNIGHEGFKVINSHLPLDMKIKRYTVICTVQKYNS